MLPELQRVAKLSLKLAVFERLSFGEMAEVPVCCALRFCCAW